MEENKNAAPSRGNAYDKAYKWILIIPAVMLVFSLIYLFNFYSHNGDLIYKDVSLTGGTTISVFDSQANVEEVKNALKGEFPDLIARSISDIRTGKQHGFFLESKANAEPLKKALERQLGYELNNENSSIEFTGSSLSSGFYKQLRIAILLSFLLMAITVFVIFRTPIRSLSVILSAFLDILFTIIVLDLFGIQVSTAGIVALLMLIGYAVDTDILVTTRVVLDREGTLNQRILGAFKTGITMTLTAMAAVAVSLIVIYNFSDTLRQMFTIILIGLGFDLLNTWVTNTSILKWYMEAKK